MKHISLITTIVLLFLLTELQSQETIIPTFECIGIYWPPEGGAVDKDVLVRFRKTGTSKWHQGLNMKYNPIDQDYDGGNYRGSIVNLTPNMKFNFNWRGQTKKPLTQ